MQGESYLVTYYKLLKVLSFKNHNVKTVILGCSIHNFGPVFIPCYDIKSNQGAQTLKSSMYYSKIFNDSIFFSTRDYIGERNFYLGIFESPKLNVFYKSTNREPSTDIIEKTLQEHYKSNLEFRINDFYLQQFYLKKIINLCELNKLNLYLLSTPLHKYYKDNIPKVFFENFKNLMKQLNVTHLDYLNDDIKNEYMSDGNHLNIEGSTVYSKLISQIVAEELNRNSK